MWIYFRHQGVFYLASSCVPEAPVISASPEMVLWTLKRISYRTRCLCLGRFNMYLLAHRLTSCPSTIVWANHMCLYLCLGVLISNCTCTKTCGLNFSVLKLLNCGILDEKTLLWAWEIAISDNFHYAVEWINYKLPSNTIMQSVSVLMDKSSW